jgi:cytidine deaminase
MASDQDQLIKAAKEVREQAHAPYSGFLVGAALQDESGNIYIGCNVENSSFPEGNCAEASAIGAMVAAGGRRIDTIAVVGGHEQLEDCTPCGGCRQRIREFSDDATRIIALDASGEFVEYSIDDLLPMSFQLK